MQAARPSILPLPKGEGRGEGEERFRKSKVSDTAWTFQTTEFLYPLRHGKSFSLGQPMSHRLANTVPMKNRIPLLARPKSEKLIVTFGAAKLVGLPNGSMELRGGRPDDKTAAKEWISLFMHEAVPRFAR
jgi:hypothetical protein